MGDVCVVSHMSRGYVTHINNDVVIRHWDTPHSTGTHHTALGHTTHHWDTSPVWCRDDICESCHTYEWAMSHIWMSHVTYIYWSKEPPPPWGGFLFTMFPDHEPVARMMHHRNSPTSHRRCGGVLSINICMTWLIHMCDMTHSYVWHDSFICVTWLIHVCDMTHIYHPCIIRECVPVMCGVSQFSWWVL